jgi:hypothetical protein
MRESSDRSRNRRTRCAGVLLVTALTVAGCGSSEPDDPADQSAQVEASLVEPLFLSDAGDKVECESRGQGKFVGTENYLCVVKDNDYGRGGIEVLLDENAGMINWKATFLPARNTLEGKSRLVTADAAAE